jgi:hypothetical protein
MPEILAACISSAWYASGSAATRAHECLPAHGRGRAHTASSRCKQRQRDMGSAGLRTCPRHTYSCRTRHVPQSRRVDADKLRAGDELSRKHRHPRPLLQHKSAPQPEGCDWERAQCVDSGVQLLCKLQLQQSAGRRGHRGAPFTSLARH